MVRASALAFGRRCMSTTRNLRKPRVAVAGATGAVGIEMRKKLGERGFPMESLRVFAHPSEEGTPIEFGGKTLKCESVGANSFDDVDIALFSAGGDFSTEWAPRAAAAGCIVVDNSSVFRMDPNCPLVVPEVNPHAVKTHQNIIANPNCTTSELAPWNHRRFCAAATFDGLPPLCLTPSPLASLRVQS